jgi:hypothetical protein
LLEILALQLPTTGTTALAGSGACAPWRA